jgi:replicative DNA helicase
MTTLDPQAEYAVVGSLLLDPAAYDRIADLGLTPESFAHAGMRAAFGAIGQLVQATRAVDAVAVYEHLRSAGAEPDMELLQAVEQSVPSSRAIRTHAEQVQGAALNRRLLGAASEALEIAEQPGAARDKLDAVQSLFAKLQAGATRNEPKIAADLVVGRIDHWQALSTGEARDGMATLIPALTRALNGGFRSGKVYILAARPSVGKSSLAEALALGVAKDGHPALFLSQEMPTDEVMDRATANLGRVDYAGLQRGEIEDWSCVTEAVERMRTLPFYVDDQPALTLLDIRAKAMAVKRHGLKVLVLDYLQLCASSGKANNRNGEIEEISRGLKALAKELGLAVLVLSQLNRDVERRVSPEPNLADLRDSGAIEQDADVVMFLWQVREFSDRLVMGLTLAKNRQGKRGVRIPLEFQGQYQRWYESEADITPPQRQSAKQSGGFND